MKAEVKTFHKRSAEEQDRILDNFTFSFQINVQILKKVQVQFICQINEIVWFVNNVIEIETELFKRFN